MKLLLGVDGGNTKTIAIVAAEDGTILGFGRSGCSDIYGAPSPAAAIEELARAVDAALTRAGRTRADVMSACFSLAGADWPEDHAFLSGEVRRLGLAQDFEVVNDALGSLRAGVTDGVGVVIACGTGFATAARNRDGQFWHGSFWLESLGGSELGYSALKAVYRAELGIDPPTSLSEPILAHFGQESVESLLRLFTLHGIPHPRYSDVSRLAPVVLQEAGRGDAAARIIVDDMAERVVNYALVAARKVDLLGQPFTLVLNGGLFREASGILHAAIREQLAGRVIDVRLVRGRYEPAVGALFHAFDRAGLALDAQRMAQIEATLPHTSLYATHA